MTASSRSRSEPSSAFDLLHPTTQRWVWDQGWTELRDIQEQAVRPILAADRDVIISAATASGKTEAAMLAVCSALATEQQPSTSDDRCTGPRPTTSTASGGVQVLCIAPTKALINDQYRRLEQLCGAAGIPVSPWHGDINHSIKLRVRRHPTAVLIITPEALEANFVRHGNTIARLLRGLRFSLVDELHTFIGTPRGAQLQSLLHRVELTIGRQPPRIALSATLGDLDAAARFLRPTNPGNVHVIDSRSDQQALRLQVRGYLEHPNPPSASTSQGDDTSDIVTPSTDAITDHLYRTLRGSDNLVFANTRRDVELYSNRLAERCARDGVFNEFHAHHGSLDKELRHDAEQALRDPTQPSTVVATSTMELGIDFGELRSVAQLGPPPSVAALRQRLGRSGRRNQPATLRDYITEPELTPDSSLFDALRCDLVHTIATVRLLLSGWLEPPDDPGYNLSTLIQQTLSTIAQHGGATPNDLHDALCGPGPFQLVDPPRYGRLLHAMASHDLIVTTRSGELLLGERGERLTNRHDFYAAFHTPREWRLVTNTRALGKIPIKQPLYLGELLMFAAQPWTVVRVDEPRRLVELVPAAVGAPPPFDGDAPLTHGRVRAEMRAVYNDTDIPAWLDPTAQRLLQQARETWQQHQLDRHLLHIDDGTITILLIRPGFVGGS